METPPLAPGGCGGGEKGTGGVGVVKAGPQVFFRELCPGNWVEAVQTGSCLGGRRAAG